MTAYATTDHLADLWGKNLTAAEMDRAETLLAAASAQLYTYAAQRGKDLDDMVEKDEYMAANARMAVCNAVMRVMRSGMEGLMASQVTESANGYSVGFTPVNSSGDTYFTKEELKWLGLNRQTYGGLDIYGTA